VTIKGARVLLAPSTAFSCVTRRLAGGSARGGICGIANCIKALGLQVWRLYGLHSAWPFGARRGFLISTSRAMLGAALLIVATAAISTFVTSKWSLFPPKDYEECAQSAAKDAKSKAALSVLLSICGSKFAGRQRPGGGYTFYDSRQGLKFDIVGPNPTSQEMEYINKQY
jgi:hypothetical protein